MDCDARRRLNQQRSHGGGSTPAPRHRSVSHPIALLPLSAARSSTSSGKLDRQGLLLLHLPQVRLVAKSIWDRMRFAVEFDDLVGFGMIGLLQAVERFDPNRGILLKTYAEHRIRGSILDGLRGMDWLPRSARQKERQQSEQPPDEGGNYFAAGKAKPAGGRKARKVAARSGKPPKPYRFPPMKSIFSGGNLGDLEKLAESFGAHRAQEGRGANPECLYESKEQCQQLAAALARLPRRQRQILSLYYRHELSMRQIATILRVHESRISQLHASALSRLRKDLSGHNDSAQGTCRIPPLPYSVSWRELGSSNRLTAAQSSSVSTPMVSRAVSVT